MAEPDPADHGASEPQDLRAEFKSMPLLAPWIDYVAHEPSFSETLNRELAQHVEEMIYDELGQIYARLKKQQQARADAGLLSPRANRTILETRLVVEAKRNIDVVHITSNMKTAMKTALAMIKTSNITTRRHSGTPVAHPSNNTALVIRRAWRGTGAMAQMLHDKRRKEEVEATAQASYHAMLRRTGRTNSTRSNGSTSSLPSPLLFVEFPKSESTLSELVDREDEANRASQDQDNQVLHFRNRPISQEAIMEAGSPLSPRSEKTGRVRYIMSTRMGALPPTKNILDEYPIPKEVLDALERHRHYHVDESSLMTSFDTFQVPYDCSNSNQPAGDLECYVRRSVPLERKPISFVLASLEIAQERPVPPPSDIFHHHIQELTSNDDLMLTEVRQLYDHTHDAYRDFRSSLHQHLSLQYLVDLSFRSSLNSTNYFIDSEELLASEPTVAIPARLRHQPAQSSVSKWRLAKKGVAGARIGRRRGAIAFHVKIDTNARTQRTELIHKLCHFSAQEVQFMDLWYSFDADTSTEQAFDPVPMAPELSARFDLVWKDLQMPPKERLDLAIKYSSLENSSRLADAVELWEVTAVLIKEREELLQLVRTNITTTAKPSAASLAEENTLLQDLTMCTTHLKEALLLTYVEVGDFVTYGGNFYLARMEHEATDLRRILQAGLEALKRTNSSNNAALGDMMNSHQSKN